MTKAVLAAALLAIAGATLALATRAGLRDFGDDPAPAIVRKPVVLARDGTPLSFSVQNEWNLTDVATLDQIPQFLQDAFIAAEDRRFFTHGGADWRARAAALVQNLRAGAAVRGASTITEQVVRMLHPRRRTLWARWLEGFEAVRLERRWSKHRILAFYLNQVPYAERRRGVRQAARLYFDRDLQTLSRREMLALAVLVRSPAGLDPQRHGARAATAADRLADALVAAGALTFLDRARLRAEPLGLARATPGVQASHFVRRVLAGAPARAPVVRSTLDAGLQRSVQRILDTTLADLRRSRAHDGGVLVVDHARNEVVAWVVSAAADPAARGYDTVLAPRQPGSTLKPLLYAMALERGWSAATLIDDSALSQAVGAGVDRFRNYSRTHYGPIRLREALGNSLNIPAVRALQFVGADAFLGRLHRVGVSSLRRHPDHYGDGLALGNGEVSLLEMTQAYTALARRGRYRSLRLTLDEEGAETQAFAPEVASLVGHILADADARRLEFGRGLQFPVETAIKTGTSTDYRDAWAIAFDHAHTVGAWIGNLDRSPMDGITGASGPALVLRSVFAELNRHRVTRGLGLDPGLAPARICRATGAAADGACPALTEWFAPGTGPALVAAVLEATGPCRLLQPTPGLLLARDPRIPDELEALGMSVDCARPGRRFEWRIDGVRVAASDDGRYLWRLAAGRHEVEVRMRDGARGWSQVATAGFTVR